MLRRSLDVSPRGISFGPKAYSLLIRMHRDLGHRVEALASCREGLEQFPDDTELLYQQSILRAEEKDLPGAEASLLRLLQSQPGYIQSSVDAGFEVIRRGTSWPSFTAIRGGLPTRRLNGRLC